MNIKKITVSLAALLMMASVGAGVSLQSKASNVEFGDDANRYSVASFKRGKFRSFNRNGYHFTVKRLRVGGKIIALDGNRHASNAAVKKAFNGHSKHLIRHRIRKRHHAIKRVNLLKGSWRSKGHYATKYHVHYGRDHFTFLSHSVRYSLVGSPNKFTLSHVHYIKINKHYYIVKGFNTPLGIKTNMRVHVYSHYAHVNISGTGSTNIFRY